MRSYNAALAGIVAAEQAEGRRVRFVDMHPALGMGDLADGVHPNATGYARMARVWHSALRGVLPNAPPRVALGAPTGDPPYVAPATVALAATASDDDGRVDRVEFLSGSTVIGTDATAPYELQ